MKTLTCTLAGASAALELCDFDGKHLRFLSDEAFAPGQPLSLTVMLAAPLSLQLKSLGSTRRADGRFDVRARAATLRREERTALLAFFRR